MSQESFGVECIYPGRAWTNGLIAEMFLIQSGQICEFELELGDQIEILSMQVSIHGIQIIAKNGETGIEKTFLMKTVPI